MLSNIKNVATCLSRITKKLSSDETLLLKDQTIILLTEQWLQQEPFIHLVNPRMPSKLHLSQYSIGSMGSDEQLIYNKGVPPDSLFLSTSSGFEAGLDEAHDLDWDSNGMQLSCGSDAISDDKAIPFSCSLMDIAKIKKQLSEISVAYTPRSSTGDLTFSESYHGIYEVRKTGNQADFNAELFSLLDK